MRITEQKLRQIIREEVIVELFGGGKKKKAKELKDEASKLVDWIIQAWKDKDWQQSGTRKYDSQRAVEKAFYKLKDIHEELQKMGQNKHAELAIRAVHGWVKDLKRSADRDKRYYPEDNHFHPSYFA